MNRLTSPAPAGVSPSVALQDPLEFAAGGLACVADSDVTGVDSGTFVSVTADAEASIPSPSDLAESAWLSDSFRLAARYRLWAASDS